MKKEKCDYCRREAKYRQIFNVQEIATEKTEVSWIRLACEIHKDHSED